MDSLSTSLPPALEISRLAKPVASVKCVRETEIPVEQQPPQGVFVYDHAGRVVDLSPATTPESWKRLPKVDKLFKAVSLKINTVPTSGLKSIYHFLLSGAETFRERERPLRTT